MPELPEVETIKRQLTKKIIGKVIEDIQILSPKNFIGDRKLVINHQIIDVQRYGKVLVIKLLNNKTKSVTNYYFNFHLKMTGQILYAQNIDNAKYSNIIPLAKTNMMPGRSTRIIIRFTDHSGIFFNDSRKFGWIKISKTPLIPKGIDILNNQFTQKLLTDILKTSNKPIKQLLLNQDLLTGIGNIYANDALFLAHIHPQRSSKSLTNKEIKLLYTSIIKVINQGIKDNGSSGADEAFIDTNGHKGSHQRHFLVYQQEDKPCIKCHTLIKRIKQLGRSSFYCSKCQI